jgi:hypothetical protein
MVQIEYVGWSLMHGRLEGCLARLCTQLAHVLLYSGAKLAWDVPHSSLPRLLRSVINAACSDERHA